MPTVADQPAVEKSVDTQRREFLVELAQAKHRAGQLGLWRTMPLDAATSVSGYELADIKVGKQADTRLAQ